MHFRALGIEAGFSQLGVVPMPKLHQKWGARGGVTNPRRRSVHRKLLGATGEGGCCTNTATGARPSSGATGGGLTALDKRPEPWLVAAPFPFDDKFVLGGGVPL